jgi:hypothetical protein
VVNTPDTSRTPEVGPPRYRNMSIHMRPVPGNVIEYDVAVSADAVGMNFAYTAPVRVGIANSCVHPDGVVVTPPDCE